MNVALRETGFREQLLQYWARWKQQRKDYTNTVEWWESSQGTAHALHTGRDRAKTRRNENGEFILCMYLSYSKPPGEEQMNPVNRLKEKVIRLHGARLPRVTIDMDDQGSF
jgi:hypothetical protein